LHIMLLCLHILTAQQGLWLTVFIPGRHLAAS